MTATLSPTHRRSPSRSTVAVAVGLLTVAALSLATDQLLQVLAVYPRWGEPMHETHLNLLALSYRIVYTIAGGYITASLAPHAAMRHVLILATLGLITGSIGAIGAISVGGLGPNWYPIAVALNRLPCRVVGWRALPRATSRPVSAASRLRPEPLRCRPAFAHPQGANPGRVARVKAHP